MRSTVSGRRARWSSGLMEDVTTMAIIASWVAVGLAFVSLEVWVFIMDRRRKNK